VHDVLDPRDLLADEWEQLRLSGHLVDELEPAVRASIDAGTPEEMERQLDALRTVRRDPAWPYDEPSDAGAVLAALGDARPAIPAVTDGLPDRLRGAWLGRAVGNTLGKPVEGLTRNEIETYLRAAGQWPLTGYIPLLDALPAGVTRLHPSAPWATAGRFTDVPRDDDIDWTILGLHLLERYGRAFTTEHVGDEWLDRLPFTQTYTAERAAYRNLIGGFRPPETATYRNPYREWIGALIRADVFGFVSPGDPAGAARLALVDARLSHTANGIYGELWAAALVAAALVAERARDALEVALRVVPPRSRLAEVLTGVLDLHTRGASVTEAVAALDSLAGSYSWVHTLNNAGLISIALLWGERFMDAAAISIAGGWDTDSTTATVGSVWGAIHGDASVPAELVGATHVHVRSAVRDFDRITIDELAARTLRLVPPAA